MKGEIHSIARGVARGSMAVCAVAALFGAMDAVKALSRWLAHYDMPIYVALFITFSLATAASALVAHYTQPGAK